MVALAVGVGFTACSVDSSEMEDAADKMEKELNEKADKMKDDIDAIPKGDVSYQCPDDCDNGPVYSEAGPCNKCGKEMVKF